MLMRVTPRVKNRKIIWKSLGGGGGGAGCCAGAKQVRDGAIALSGPALVPPLCSVCVSQS